MHTCRRVENMVQLFECLESIWGSENCKEENSLLPKSVVSNSSDYVPNARNQYGKEPFSKVPVLKMEVAVQASSTRPSGRVRRQF